MKRNVNVMKEWFKNGRGREIVKYLLPEQEEMIFRYLNVPQYLNREEISGVYHFSFAKDNVKHSAYIGEAGNVYFRLLEHLYNLFNNITEWGLSPESFLEDNIKIDWICEVGISNENMRRKMEREKIEEFKPFLQYTSPNSPEYGDDKKQYGEIRENVRPDYCVCKDLRKKRAMALFCTNVA